MRAPEFSHLRAWKNPALAQVICILASKERWGWESPNQRACPEASVHLYLLELKSKMFRETMTGEIYVWSLGAWKVQEGKKGHNLGDNQSFINCQTWSGKSTWEVTGRSSKAESLFSNRSSKPHGNVRNQSVQLLPAFKRLSKSATNYTQHHLRNPKARCFFWIRNIYCIMFLS